MKKKTIGIIIVSVLGAAAIFCSAMFTHQYLSLIHISEPTRP